MKKNFLIVILFSIFIVSFITFILIFNYLDPYADRLIALVSMGISFFFSVTCLSTLCLYGFKKIYFRGEVTIGHLMSSFRQSIMISTLLLGVFIFISIGAPVFISALLLGIILIFIELFIKNLEV